jgi:DNA-binding MarR family transcriptional regulator/N-acetylglutamate synthase-like GNAT family acetyltransferase
MNPTPDLPGRVAAVRRFNRFYTRQIGVLQQGLLRSPFSLTEVRVLWELAHRDAPTASELGRDLDLDQGYLSRILRALARRGLITRRRAESDGRQTLLGLSARGRQTFAGLNARSDEEIGGLLGALPPGSQVRLVEAMETIERLLTGPEPTAAPWVLRPPRPGDLGWIVHRHGALYAQEYGWDERFEGLVAGVVSEFVRHYDPKGERCWIAERAGRIVGCVFLVRQSKQVAKLRLLLVEPEARGLGIGSRLVAECVGLARALGYRKLILWTNDVLHEARRIYQRAGFRLVEEEPHASFGEGLVGQTWELDLREGAARGSD